MKPGSRTRKVDDMRAFRKISQESWQTQVPGTSYQEIKLPRRATLKSAGYDLYSPAEVVLNPRETVVVPTGIKVYMEDDEVLLVNSRSGHGFRHGVRLRNIQGWIDADYADNTSNEGHILVAMVNDGNEPFVLPKGKAIAQAMFIKYLVTEDDEPVNQERTGGIGSTR